MEEAEQRASPGAPVTDEEVDQLIRVLVDAITSALGPEAAQQDSSAAERPPAAAGHAGMGVDAAEELLHSMLGSAVQAAARQRPGGPPAAGAAAAAPAGPGLLSPALMLQPRREFDTVADIQQLPAPRAAAPGGPGAAAAGAAEKRRMEELVRDALLRDMQPGEAAGRQQAPLQPAGSWQQPVAAAAAGASAAQQGTASGRSGGPTRQGSVQAAAGPAMQPGQALLDLLVEALMAEEGNEAGGLAGDEAAAGGLLLTATASSFSGPAAGTADGRLEQLRWQPPAPLADVTNTDIPAQPAAQGAAGAAQPQAPKRFSLPGMEKLLDSTDVSDAEPALPSMAGRRTASTSSSSQLSSWEGPFLRNRRLLEQGLATLQAASSKQGRLVTRRQLERKQRHQQHSAESSGSEQQEPGQGQLTPPRPAGPKAPPQAAAGPGLGFHNPRYTLVEDRRTSPGAPPLPATAHSAQLSPIIRRSEAGSALQQPIPSESPAPPSKPLPGRARPQGSERQAAQGQQRQLQQQQRSRPHGPPGLDSYQGPAMRRLWRAVEGGEEWPGAAAALLEDPLLRPGSSGSDGYSDVQSSSASGYSSSLTSSSACTAPGPLRGVPGLGPPSAPGGEEPHGGGSSSLAAQRLAAGRWPLGLSSRSLAAESSWQSSGGSRSDAIRAKLGALAARRRQAVAEVGAGVAGLRRLGRTWCDWAAPCHIPGSSAAACLPARPPARLPAERSLALWRRAPQAGLQDSVLQSEDSRATLGSGVPGPVELAQEATEATDSTQDSNVMAF
jgi:hypothetical protein